MKFIIKNTGWLLLAEVVKSGSLFLLSIMIARLFGVTLFGQFVFVIAIAGLVAPLADFGLGTILIRDIAHLGDKNKVTLRNVCTLKLGFSIVALLILFSATFLVPSLFEVKWLVVIAGFWIVVDSAVSFLQSIFRAHEKMQYEALTSFGYAVFLLLFVGAALLYARQLHIVLLGYLSAGVIGVIISALIVHKRFISLRFGIDKKILKTYIKSGVVIFISTVAFVLYFKIDVILLGVLRTQTEVGLYSAVYALVFGFRIIPLVVANGYYPKFAKATPYEGWDLLMSGHKLIGGVSALIALVLFVFREQIVLFFYGEKFLQGVVVLLPLVLAYFFNALSHLNFSYLYARRKEAFIMKVVLGGLLLNVVLNLIVIPRYSFLGAAYTSLITESIVLLLLLRVNVSEYTKDILKKPT